MTPKVWYLLLTLSGSAHPISYPITFETEADCEYAGKSLQARAAEQNFWKVYYLCWHPGKPPVRPMGGR